MLTSEGKDSMKRALEGILVVALEQAVAAPFATSRLADAGARVIKLERHEGDFARGYDGHANGHSSYFVWLNRGKESCRVDLRARFDGQELLVRRLSALGVADLDPSEGAPPSCEQSANAPSRVALRLSQLRLALHEGRPPRSRVTS